MLSQYFNINTTWLLYRTNIIFIIADITRQNNFYELSFVRYELNV